MDWEIIFISIGLAMDAVAVAICKGLAIKKIKFKQALIIGLMFGFFQGLMPLIGWLLTKRFAIYIISYSHWIAFILLFIIGGKMFLESFKRKDDKDLIASFSFKEIIILAIATSIDALAVGVTFALHQDLRITLAIFSIGIITCILSFIGVYLGSRFGKKLSNKAEFFGGLILLLIGFKILLEGLGII